MEVQPAGDMDSVDCGEEALDFDYEIITDTTTVQDIVVTKPGVPFLHRLKSRISPHCSFIIDGEIFDNANALSVNLCSHYICPKDNVVKKNIAIHFNVRLPMNCVVRNSYINDTWGHEEIRTFKRNPLKRGLHFGLELFVSPREYLIAVNGSHFCTFAHRLPFQEVTTIEIHGDITLNRVELTTSKYYPSISIEPSTTVGALEVPFTRKFSRSISTTTSVMLKGAVYILPFNFFVNLQCGSYVYPHPLIAFHMSVRWQPSQEDVIVFNSWTEDQWDTEMVMPRCDLFQPGADFVLKIEIGNNGFLVVINDFPLPLFQHRMKAELIDTLFVQGDVQLTLADACQ